MIRSIPTKDADFNVRQEIIVTTSLSKATEWGLDEQWINSALVPHKNEWDLAWAAYQDPMTRTPTITRHKQSSRKNYEPALRLLVRMLESNPHVTDDDRNAMGIATPSGGRRPSPPPSTFPDCTVDSSVIRRLTISFRDHGSLTRGKPHGVHGAEICWAILPAPPADVKELVNSAFDTQSPLMLEFTESQRGSTIWFCMRWENKTGQKGPWGEIQNAIIP
jgi:hypothetical protein